MTTPAYLYLEDGSIFKGVSIGAQGSSLGEVVFNTSMSGYQEILTDPSYCKQIVTLTYPHIGNVGTNPEDYESSTVFASALVVRSVPIVPSNWRKEKTLTEFLCEHDIPGIANIDTRRLTRLLREKGALNGIVTTEIEQLEEAQQQINSFPGLKGMDLAKEVTTSESYPWNEGVWSITDGYSQAEQNDNAFKVVAMDFGVKRNILRILADLGCAITVVPAMTSFEDIQALNPDGVFLSNGPGDPEPCTYAIETIQKVMAAKIPTFGICLGHQLLGLACGANTIKMKFGHHGANHPVQCLEKKNVMISSQNHGFAVDEETLPETLLATHRSLFDGSLQGIRHRDLPVYGFQGHPEASPGPHDVRGLFDAFIADMKAVKAS